MTEKNTLLETEPERYLILPMPRASMGTVRVEGHTLRVRHCNGCGVYTTIPVCASCGAAATSSTPDEASLNRDSTPSLVRGRRPERALGPAGPSRSRETRADSFYLWWVEKRGRPPMAADGEAFRLAQAAWVARRRATQLGPDAIEIVHAAWADADSLEELESELSSPGSDIVRRFQRDSIDVVPTSEDGDGA